jgi:AraC-like DNA-binding protein
MTENGGNYQVRVPLFDRESRRLPVLGFSLGHLAGTPPYEGVAVKRRGYYLLGWVEEGELVARVGAGEQRVAAGQAMVLPPGEATGFQLRGPCRRYQLKFRGFAASAILKSFGIRPGQVLQAGAPLPAVFERLRQALKDVAPAGAVQASVSTYEILARLSGEDRRSGGRHPLVARALAALEAGWQDASLNVKVLAQRLGVNRTFLSQRFKAGVGVSPGEYLRRCRIREALSLLESTDWPIAEVARRCGYPGASQFARLIRKAAGMSPRRVRRER